MSEQPEISPHRFAVSFSDRRGFRQAYVHRRASGVERPAVLLVHGWPESKRIYWKVIDPLVEAGFDVIVPDLRGFGDSGPAPDGLYDNVSHVRDIRSLICDELGYDKVVAVGGDMGGPVVQELALRYPDLVDRMVLFNSPLPFDKVRMAGIVGTRAPREASDYYMRQGLDADALARELADGSSRRNYIATFYTSRFWAHPGAFTSDEVDFHTEPFADAAVLRASFGGYEAVFDPAKRSEPSIIGRNEVTPTLVLFGPSDHVIYPAFDRMAEQVFARCIGPFLLRDCGHFVPWEAPRPFESGVTAFCRDLLTRG